MAVNNSLTKPAKPQTGSGLTEYESNGETVRLSPEIIKSYLVSGGGDVTNQEVMMFLSLCRFQHLNPFLKEAYLIKYGSSPATMVTGKDVFTKRAQRNKDYAGKRAGIIVRNNETGETEQREGTFYLPQEETIVGGWARVMIKNRESEFAAVSFDEYAGRTKDGKLNSQWSTRPATMIRKVALVQALREAFPEDYTGLVSPEEVPEANGVLTDAAPITAKTAAETQETPAAAYLTPEAEKTTPAAEKPLETPESALFG